MAMNGSQLGQEMKALVDAYIAGLTDEEKRDVDDTLRQRVYEEMGKAIVAHIIANAVVTTTGTTTGVTTGGSTAPCASTGGVSA
ncbi:MAG: hypothetical protein ACFFDT_04185 [Candidatus Hodarchaeota archaeon]